MDSDIEGWARENIEVVVALVIGLVILGIAFWILLIWLSSRGRFMFLENVVRNRPAVKKPWREFLVQGNSLFAFRVVFGILSFLAATLLAGIVALMLVPSFQAKELDPLGIAGIVTGALGFICFILAMIVITVLLEDFVIPIMFVRRCRCVEAWREFRAVSAGHGLTIFVYFLFKILLGIVVGIMALAVVCALCCIAWIPYIGTVLILPFLVFHRSYSVYFMQQFHDDYRLLPLNPANQPPMPEARPSR
jgi:hypothetical protein